MFIIYYFFSGSRVNEPQTPQNPKDSVLPQDGLSTMERKKARIDEWVDDIIKRKPDKGSSGKKDNHGRLERQPSGGSRVRSGSPGSRGSSGRERKQPGHRQPQGINYTSPPTMQPSPQDHGKYSQLGPPPEQRMNIIPSQAGTYPGQVPQGMPVGQTGAYMTGPGFIASNILSPVRVPRMMPPQHNQYQQQRSQIGYPGQNVPYHQNGGHYLSQTQPGVPGNYISHGNLVVQEGGTTQFLQGIKGAFGGLTQWLPGLPGSNPSQQPAAINPINPGGHVLSPIQNLQMYTTHPML